MFKKKLIVLLALSATSAMSAVEWTEDSHGNVIHIRSIPTKADESLRIVRIDDTKMVKPVEPKIVKPVEPKRVVQVTTKPGELAIDHKGKKIMGQSKKDVECLAYSIFREAGTLSENAQLAVGQVHINRLKEGSWGDRMCEVVYSKAQFSWTMEKYVAWSDSQKSKFIKQAKDLMNGERVKKLDSEDILHYHATYVQPKWAKQGQLVAQAGAHLFYKNVPF